jgi:hypothetical protein
MLSNAGQLNLHRSPWFLAAYNQKEGIWNKPLHNLHVSEGD